APRPSWIASCTTPRLSASAARAIGCGIKDAHRGDRRRFKTSHCAHRQRAQSERFKTNQCAHRLRGRNGGFKTSQCAHRLEGVQSRELTAPQKGTLLGPEPLLCSVIQLTGSR